MSRAGVETLQPSGRFEYRFGSSPQPQAINKAFAGFLNALDEAYWANEVVHSGTATHHIRAAMLHLKVDGPFIVSGGSRSTYILQRYLLEDTSAFRDEFSLVAKLLTQISGNDVTWLTKHVMRSTSMSLLRNGNTAAVRLTHEQQSMLRERRLVAQS